MLLASLVLIAVTAPGLDNAADQPPASGAQVSAPAPAQADAAPAAVPLPEQSSRDSGRDALIVLGAVVFAAVFSIFNYARAGK